MNCLQLASMRCKSVKASLFLFNVSNTLNFGALSKSRGQRSLFLCSLLCSDQSFQRFVFLQCLSCIFCCFSSALFSMSKRFWFTDLTFIVLWNIDIGWASAMSTFFCCWLDFILLLIRFFLCWLLLTRFVLALSIFCWNFLSLVHTKLLASLKQLARWFWILLQWWFKCQSCYDK